MVTRRFGGVRTPRKDRLWGITTANGSLIAATPATMIVFPLMSSLKTDVGYEMPGVTASAIRLNVTYRQTAAQLGIDDTIAAGIGWVSDTAIASSGAALPDPSTDHFDWMFHDIRTISAVTVASADQVPANGNYTIRNDSMRKQRENHSALVMIFRCTLLQSTNIQIFVGGRVLFLLP